MQRLKPYYDPNSRPVLSAVQDPDENGIDFIEDDLPPDTYDYISELETGTTPVPSAGSTNSASSDRVLQSKILACSHRAYIEIQSRNAKLEQKIIVQILHQTSEVTFAIALEEAVSFATQGFSLCFGPYILR